MLQFLQTCFVMMRTSHLIEDIKYDNGTTIVEERFALDKGTELLRST